MATDYIQPSMLLSTGSSDDIDSHLDECLCDDCVDNIILAMREDRQHD